jgi:spore maturation protein SpmB
MTDEKRNDPSPGPLGRGLRRGWHACWALFRLTVPIFILMDLLKRLGAIQAFGELCAPIMSFFLLPGEAAVPVLLGLSVNVVAATAALGNLGLTGGQVTTLGLMIGVAHSLPVETMLLKAFGTRAMSLLLYRVLLAVLVGFVASRLFIGVAP